MITRILLVLSYIFWCCRVRVAPWKYFQLNADYFNEKRRLFSKLDMDKLIAKQWRLDQCVDNGAHVPQRFPVFIKPEWGQNSRGVQRIDNLEQLLAHRRQRSGCGPRYLLQEAASGACEFEIFCIAAVKSDPSSVLISVTQTGNHSSELHPINGIYNKQTYYRAICLSKAQRAKITSLFTRIGEFKIARYCARADSLGALLLGRFSIVEINVYLPMPLLLLAKNISKPAQLRFLFKAMKQLALVTKDIPDEQRVKSIFFANLSCKKLLRYCFNRELLP